ncbi:MAG: hypothetical protein ACI8ZB_003076 [Desulforhopalus sp.]|jgi:hypothetical protein
MEKITKEFQSYLSNNLGVSVNIELWQKGKNLPKVLRECCSFFTFDLFATKYLVMTILGQAESSPIHVRRYIDMLAEYWEDEIILLLPMVTSYNRKRLIERKISFVVPGNQMYLPLCGIDLSEHFRSMRIKKKHFSPSTQVILLSVIYGRMTGRITPSILAQKLKYTQMTMSRGLDEIKSASLCSEQSEWRERVVCFEGNTKNLWERASCMMKSPVGARYKILFPSGTIALPLIDAGEYALSRYNMVAKPSRPVYALSSETWKALLQIDGVVKLDYDEPDSVEIEVWKRRPEQFSKKQLIDPLSLYLSLRESEDDGVQIGLEKLIKFVNEGLRSIKSN